MGGILVCLFKSDPVSVCCRWEDHPDNFGSHQIRTCCVISDNQKDPTATEELAYPYLFLHYRQTSVVFCSPGDYCMQEMLHICSGIWDERLQTNYAQHTGVAILYFLTDGYQEFLLTLRRTVSYEMKKIHAETWESEEKNMLTNVVGIKLYTFLIGTSLCRAWQWKQNTALNIIWIGKSRCKCRHKAEIDKIIG